YLGAHAGKPDVCPEPETPGPGGTRDDRGPPSCGDEAQRSAIALAGCPGRGDGPWHDRSATQGRTPHAAHTGPCANPSGVSLDMVPARSKPNGAERPVR